MINPVTLLDSESICEIYNYYVENSAITFEDCVNPSSVTTNEVASLLAKA